MGGLNSFFEARASKIKCETQQHKELYSSWNWYFVVGGYILQIIVALNRSYLDSMTDFSEITAGLCSSVPAQFVYKLKLRRAMTQNEAIDLARVVGKQLSQILQLDYAIFVKKYSVRCVGDELFLTVKKNFL